MDKEGGRRKKEEGPNNDDIRTKREYRHTNNEELRQKAKELHTNAQRRTTKEARRTKLKNA